MNFHDRLVVDALSNIETVASDSAVLPLPPLNLSAHSSGVIVTNSETTATSHQRCGHVSEHRRKERQIESGAESLGYMYVE